MKSFRRFLEEDMGGLGVAPTNNVGSGNIAGVGVGPKGEPGVPGRLLRRKKLKPLSVDKVNESSSSFMGHKVFEVGSNVFHNSRFGKKKYSRWIKATENNADVIHYGKKTRKPIIVADKSTGSMYFFRHPRDKRPL